MRIELLAIFCLMLTLQLNGQQDALHTQFGYNKLVINPAFAGKEYYSSVSVMVRDQWNGFDGAPNHQLISASIPLQKSKVGLGFIGSRSSIGIEDRLELKGIYAYQIRLGLSRLRLALQATGRRYSIDFTDDRLLAIDGVNEDPGLVFQNYNINTFNAGIGALYTIKKMYFGLSVPRLLNAQYGQDRISDFTREERIMYAMFGYIFTVNDKVQLTSQVLYKATKIAPYDLDIQGGLIYNEDYHIGLNFRSGGGNENRGESLALIIGLEPTSQLFFGFAYDFTFSKIRRHETGTLEAILQYNIGKKSDSSQYITNPRYF